MKRQPRWQQILSLLAGLLILIHTLQGTKLSPWSTYFLPQFDNYAYSRRGRPHYNRPFTIQLHYFKEEEENCTIQCAGFSWPELVCMVQCAQFGADTNLLTGFRICKYTRIFLGDQAPQLSVNGVGLTKPLTTSLSPTSKHSSHLREPSKGGRQRLGWHNRLLTKY